MKIMRKSTVVFKLPALFAIVICFVGAVQAASTDVTNACRADAKRLCHDVLGDEEKRHACMHEHRDELSTDCRSAIKKSNQQAGLVVAFGASNVSGWNVSASAAFPAQIQSMLRAQGYNTKVLNRGVYGNTTTDMRRRMDTDIPHETTVVILDMSGGFFNNANKGISREQGQADIETIKATLNARGIKIIPESTADIPSSYKQEDGKHLTAEGHKLLATELLPAITRALGSPQEDGSKPTESSP